MEIKESGEMYLETILVLTQKNGFVRSIDVADYMGFSKPAVSRATSKLKAESLIIIDRDGCITLTDSGRAVAEKIYERHTMLTHFLVLLGVDAETAAADACKIEHDISAETFEAMKRHYQKHAEAVQHSEAVQHAEAVQHSEAVQHAEAVQKK